MPLHQSRLGHGITREDPRAQPGAYIRRQQRLFEVLDIDAGGLAWIEDCLTDERVRVQLASLATFTLVKPAPPNLIHEGDSL